MVSPRVVAVSVVAICYLGLIANRGQADRLAAGLPLDLANPTVSAWQVARDGLLVIVVAALLFTLPRHQRTTAAETRIPPVALLSALFVAVASIATLLRHDSGILALAVGLRGVVVVILLVLVRHYGPEDRALLLRWIAIGVIPFVAVEAAIAYLQVTGGPATLGRTMFGSRPWGTFASSNNLGLAMLGCLTITVLARPRLWRLVVLVAAATCLLAGSRTAILGVILVLTGAIAARWRTRGAAMPLGLGLLFAVYSFASSAAVSGRTIDGEARFGNWQRISASIDGPASWLIGQGIGAGSNGVVGLQGTRGAAGSTISDSTIVATVLSFGLVGLTGLVIGFVALWRATAFDRRFVVLPMLLIAALSFNVPELSPFNVLIAVAAGSALPPCKCGLLRERALPSPGRSATAASCSTAPTAIPAASSATPGTRTGRAAPTYPG
jgi:hypothetical protein